MSGDPQEPISAEEIAVIIRKAVNARFGLDIAEAPRGDSFEMTAPATGQRFRVTVAEIPAADAVDAAIAACNGGERQ